MRSRHLFPIPGFVRPLLSSVIRFPLKLLYNQHFLNLGHVHHEVRSIMPVLNVGTLVDGAITKKTTICTVSRVNIVLLPQT
jgi:hypothetical protein